MKDYEKKREILGLQSIKLESDISSEFYIVFFELGYHQDIINDLDLCKDIKVGFEILEFIEIRKENVKNVLDLLHCVQTLVKKSSDDYIKYKTLECKIFENSDVSAKRIYKIMTVLAERLYSKIKELEDEVEEKYRNY